MGLYWVYTGSIMGETPRTPPFKATQWSFDIFLVQQACTVHRVRQLSRRLEKDVSSANHEVGKAGHKIRGSLNSETTLIVARRVPSKMNLISRGDFLKPWKHTVTNSLEPEISRYCCVT
jgi:hypothetical protein